MAFSGRTPITRRDFFKTTAGALAAAGLAGCAEADQSAQAPEVDQPMPASASIPVGVQLYCFRHLLEEDFPGTLAQVATLGYDGVEFAGYYDYSAADLRQMIDGHGLQCSSAHVGLDTLLGDELQKSIDFHQALGNSRLIVAAISQERRVSKDIVLRTAEAFSEIMEKLRPHGLRTGYHCHAYSFNTLLEGETIWDLLADNTPDDFILQLDTGNAANGGADIPEVIKRHPGKIRSMHVKPYLASAEEPFDPYIGDDGLPWNEIFDLSETVGGIEWYVVEYEQEAHPPLEALKANRERVSGFGR